MLRPLHAISFNAERLGVPILFAGDLFDHWRASPELINWAIENVPVMCGIPGQHDLPLHNLEDLHKSAFYTLVHAGIIKLLDHNSIRINQMNVQGFAWGQPIINPKPVIEGTLQIAVIHHYIWEGNHCYPGAPAEDELKYLRKRLHPFDCAVFGDNHKGFLANSGSCKVFNCGSLLRRKSDEIHYEPQVGLLHESGEVEVIKLDISKDVIEATESTKSAEADADLESFLKELAKLKNSKLDFVDTMEDILREKKPDPAVRKFILEAMEKTNGR
jgi:DNA repair exonuclease SbcCD nuclease subunit